MSEVKKYKSKPVVIEAVKFIDLLDYPEIRRFAENNIGPLVTENGKRYFCVNTPEGNMRVELGDWVIRGLLGEFYPCKHEVFIKKYEAVDE